ncbi:hypothetical protein pb186bvf_015717 [Paramecium bursaria]
MLNRKIIKEQNDRNKMIQIISNTYFNNKIIKNNKYL